MIHVRPKDSNIITLFQRVDTIDYLYLHYAIACVYEFMNCLVANLDPYGKLKTDTLCAALSYKDLNDNYRIRVSEADQVNDIFKQLQGEGIETMKTKFIGVYPLISFGSIPSYLEFKQLKSFANDQFYNSFDSFLQSNETTVCAIKFGKDDKIDFKMPE